MRSKIFAVVVLAVGAVGCGNSSNSSTGSTAASAASASSATAGSAGSTGGSTAASTAGSTTGTNGLTPSTGGTGTTGTTGTTGSGGLCNIPGSDAGVACLEGQTCQVFGAGTNIGAYNACACNYVGEFLSDGGSGAVDSCANNLDGTTVCDPFTFQCRAPRDFEPCNLNKNSSAPACDPNMYTCVQFELYPDGGGDGGQECLQVCQAPTDCTANNTTCSPNQLMGELADGGVVNLGACVASQCGPKDVPYFDGGSGPLGDYYGSCTNITPGDGTCIPFPSNTTPPGLVGQCFLNGSVQALNGQCDNETAMPTNQLCASGSFCLLTGLAPAEHLGGTLATAECFPLCNLNAPNDGGYNELCPSIGGQSLTCMQLFNVPASFDPDPNPGVCE